MFLKHVFTLFIFVSTTLNAFTVKTIAAGDWENPNSWSNNQVPVTPDSIIVSHYMVINQNLTLNAPTVLFIDSLGTICGEYLLETLCAASFINYGHLYLGQIKTRAGLNYHYVACKNYAIISGCGASGGYYNNLPPNGSTYVWPPVLCKTQDTNWEIGTIGIAEFENGSLRFYPNPIRNGVLTIVTKNTTELKIINLIGTNVLTQIFDNQTEVQLNFLPNGIYFLELVIGENKLVKKIIKCDQ